MSALLPQPTTRKKQADLLGFKPPSSCISAAMAKESSATPIGPQILLLSFLFCVMSPSGYGLMMAPDHQD
jgi:hypothetical protein